MLLSLLTMSKMLERKLKYDTKRECIGFKIVHEL
jgi:hypothetical protein